MTRIVSLVLVVLLRDLIATTNVEALTTRFSSKRCSDASSCTTGSSSSNVVPRSAFLRWMIAAAAGSSGTLPLALPRRPSALAFEGGVGGLGKTKPETGVYLFEETSTPIQNPQGIVSAEIRVGGNPVRVEFQAPWPLLSTAAGLEARTLSQPESAFVQVVEPEDGGRKISIDKAVLKKAVSETVLGQKGKFGAYLTPTNVRFSFPDKNDPTLSVVTFTAYTPSMLESDRKLFVKAKEIEGALVLLVTGTTLVRFSSQEKTLGKIVDSFTVVPGPKSSLR